MDYRARYPFEARAAESRRIREKFPGRIPIIVTRATRAHNVPLIDKHKFLCPGDLSFSQFLYIVRRRLVLPPETALFLFIGNSLPTSVSLVREVYAAHADSDGFLYVQYSGENTFGYAEDERGVDHNRQMYGTTLANDYYGWSRRRDDGHRSDIFGGGTCIQSNRNGYGNGHRRVRGCS